MKQEGIACKPQIPILNLQPFNTIEQNSEAEMLGHKSQNENKDLWFT